MLFTRVHIDSFGYELAPNVVSSDALEERLAPVYQALKFQPGQLYALTGIRERRWWEKGQTMWDGAARAACKALARSSVAIDDIGMLIYAGVCRDQLEPATACAACLAQINAMMHIANAIELGQVRAGLVCSCESARQIVDLTIERLLQRPDMQAFKLSLATLTGGSGAAAVVLADASLSQDGHRLLGGVVRTNPRWHKLCRWGPDTGIPATAPMFAQTDAPAVLEHGVKLGAETFAAFRDEIGWPDDAPDKVICHQVGAGHRVAALAAIGVPTERDFSTFEYLGNIGTAALPITAAIADERGFLERGDRVGLFGIGSGLNCLLLGAEW